MNHATEEKWGVRFDQVAGTSGSGWMSPERMRAVLADDQAVFAAREVVVKESQVWNGLNGRAVEVESYKQAAVRRRWRTAEPDLRLRRHHPAQARRGRAAALVPAAARTGRRTRNAQGRRPAPHRARHPRRPRAEPAGPRSSMSKCCMRAPATATRASSSASAHVLGTIDATIRSVRAIMNDLHPSTLELGLPVALEWLVDAVREAQRHPLPRCGWSATTRRCRTSGAPRWFSGSCRKRWCRCCGTRRRSRIDVTLAIGRRAAVDHHRR